MKPDPTDDEIASVYRVASQTVDDRPVRDVRSAVLAAATRSVEARPSGISKRADGRSGAWRWPLSAAALMVVSVMTGLVVRQTMQERPDLVTPVAQVAPAPVAEPDREAAPRGPATAPAQAAAPAPAPSPAAKTDALHATAIERPAAGDVAGTRDQAAAGFDPTTRRRRADDVEPPTPEAWVERIVAMRASGHDDDADRELAALRRRYPTFDVPARARPTAGR